MQHDVAYLESLFVLITMKHSVTLFCVEFLILTLALQSQASMQAFSRFKIDNRARYSKNRQLAPEEQEQLSLDSYQEPRIIGSSSKHSESPPRFNYNQGQLNQKSDSLLEKDETVSHSNQLDSEDKSLLDKFYQETRGQDPFQSESLSSQQLWDGMHDGTLFNLMEALRDYTPALDSIKADVNHDNKHQSEAEEVTSVSPEKPVDKYEQKELVNEWSLDNELAKQAEELARIGDEKILPHAESWAANYSPGMRLLTSYNPMHDERMSLAPGGNRDLIGENNDNGGDNMMLTGSRIVGATLAGNAMDVQPKVSSKSPLEAIKMHNELFEKPPRDGKVRVRMYFHRAIHDDVRLYGTGPWKYWGHGWGVEYGFDPAKKGANDFYQKGYTIERAYGRDFCRDKANCRPPGAEFISRPHTKRFEKTASSASPQVVPIQA